MEIKKGIPVSPGVAICDAFVLDSEDYRIPERYVATEEVEREVERLEKALEAAQEEIRLLKEKIGRELSGEYIDIFQAHLTMIADKKLKGEISRLIRENNFTAEYATSRALRRYIKAFQTSEDPYLAERIADFRDIEKRLLRNLLGERREKLSSLSQEVVIVAKDLSPSQAASLDRAHVRGFATDVGGRTSHTAIVARALEIPAVVGLGTITSDVSGGDLVIIDGNHGVVIINPDDETLSRYRKLERQFQKFEKELVGLAELPAVTLDGHRIKICANIEFPHEIEVVLRNNADGIGLFRTEFLFLDRSDEPSEEEHFEAYLKVVRSLAPRPVVIRTMDLGADKLIGAGLPPERNPFLGCRSIRLSLIKIDTFKTQLRAILRASAYGDVRILFPMISVVEEVRHAKSILRDVMGELESSRIPFNKDIPIGAMIEVPSAALSASTLAKEVDFFSIGTNDLIQYTLAVDRVNERVAFLYSPSHSSVLKLLRMILQAAKHVTIPVAMCGEMCGDVLYTLLLVGMGLEEFSVAPGAIQEVKKVIRSTTLTQAQEVARRAEEFEEAGEALAYLAEVTRKILPEAF